MEVQYKWYNYKDKDVVEPIAVSMREIYGEENVFYDAWSIKPGESIIGKMNEGIGKCKYFFFFTSQNSLNSSMVDLEWQTALYKGRYKIYTYKGRWLLFTSNFIKYIIYRYVWHYNKKIIH